MEFRVNFWALPDHLFWVKAPAFTAGVSEAKTGEGV